MTKIKNTKKGVAKKTLSMSLVVAMLATSNVPVWAAEFSDDFDAAVATEAPVTAFSDKTMKLQLLKKKQLKMYQLQWLERQILLNLKLINQLYGALMLMRL